MAASADALKSVFYPLRNFLDPQKSRNEPVHEWDLGSVLVFFEHRRTILLEEYDLGVKRGTSFSEKSTTPVPKSHLNRYVSAFRKFVDVTCVNYLGESDFKMIDIEAQGWESIYRCPRKQAGGIPPRVLKAWGGSFLTIFYA